MGDMRVPMLLTILTMALVSLTACGRAEPTPASRAAADRDAHERAAAAAASAHVAGSTP